MLLADILKKNLERFDIRKLLVFIALVALFIFAVYSVKQYRQSGIAEQGIVTCVDSQCYWSAHIHVYAPIEICGEKYTLPRFEGLLSGFHTHGEVNVIHWHASLAFDPLQKRFLDPSPFVLQRIFDGIEISVDQENIFGKKDGDLCLDGVKGNWMVFINGTPRQDWRGYEWRDQDIIFFVFDGRKPEEIESHLRVKPFTFPALGEG